MGRVVCKEGLLVDQAKIAVIVYMPPNFSKDIACYFEAYRVL